MSIDPTFRSSSSAIGIGALSSLNGGGRGGEVEGAVRSLASTVVGQVAASLGTAGAGPVGQGDIYGIGPLAEGIGTALGATNATQVGDLTRALEGFAGAVAADMAARADGRTLDRIDQALADAPLSGAGGVDGVIHGLSQATTAIETAR